VPLRIVALVKQIPAFAELHLDAEGRLDRAHGDLEMNPYCRRAVAGSVALAAAHGGSVTVVTLGPDAAEDVLREAIAWGSDHGVPTSGVLVSDPVFAGSDTLATARALAATITRLGPFDLVVAGRNSVDADTGQVPPELAELLDLPLLAGVRDWSLDGRVLEARCEHDDGWLRARMRLPGVVTTAERLVDPCKVEPAARAAVDPARIERLRAEDLGPGPWGAALSPTTVGAPTPVVTTRAGERDPHVDLATQVARAVQVLSTRGAITAGRVELDPPVASAPVDLDGPVVAAVVEPGRDTIGQEMVATAARLAATIGGHAAAVTFESGAHATGRRWGRWGAGRSVEVRNAATEEDAANGLTAWAVDARPWAILAPGTLWGREVAGRTAAALGAGLTGDAVAFEVGSDRRLVALKSGVGGAWTVPITCTSDVQMATIRPGVLPAATPRPIFDDPRAVHIGVAPRRRVEVLERSRDDDLDLLADARRVVGVGRGVDPADYPALEPLTRLLGAQLAATRKVTDAGWMPRARQLGITGRAVAPELHIAIGTSGRFNHAIGFARAGTVLAIDADPEAPILDLADVGIVGDWREVLELLVPALAVAMARG
jgi:electron transfer flavoprotein alpha subunit